MLVRMTNLLGLGFETVSDVVFSTNHHLHAFCGLSMIDSNTDFDRDNAVAVDIAFRNRNSTVRDPWIFGGDHWGDYGAFTNFHLPASSFYGNAVRFRIRSFNAPELQSAGFGVVLAS